MRRSSIAAASLLALGLRVVVEQGPPQEVINNPQHERTKSFLSRIKAEHEQFAAAVAELTQE